MFLLQIVWIQSSVVLANKFKIKNVFLLFRIIVSILYELEMIDSSKKSIRSV